MKFLSYKEYLTKKVSGHDDADTEHKNKKKSPVTELNNLHSRKKSEYLDGYFTGYEIARETGDARLENLRVSQASELQDRLVKLNRSETNHAKCRLKKSIVSLINSSIESLEELFYSSFIEIVRRSTKEHIESIVTPHLLKWNQGSAEITGPQELENETQDILQKAGYLSRYESCDEKVLTIRIKVIEPIEVVDAMKSIPAGGM